eukprot:snap_masked-scaffold_11-processed-gene-7.49-mRNA-1 protein AED:1.00 eAED:1.00 QI:0/-1/0/0/-1/1/1/0/60
MEERSVFNSLLDFDAIHKLTFAQVQQGYANPVYFWVDVSSPKKNFPPIYSVNQYSLQQPY